MNAAILLAAALDPRLPAYFAAEARLVARNLLRSPGRGGPDSAVTSGTVVAGGAVNKPAGHDTTCCDVLVAGSGADLAPSPSVSRPGPASCMPQRL